MDGENTFGRVSSEAIQASTGHSWSDWLDLLDEAGAASWDHRRIVAHLESSHPELTNWWRQSITVGYEQARGIRAVGETSSGFQVGVQRAVDATPEQVWEILVGRTELWLGEKVELEPGASYSLGKIKVVKPGDRIRFSWQPAGWPNAVSAQLTILTSKSGKTALHVQLEKLPDAVAREAMRVRWRGVLEGIAAECGA